MCTIIVSKSHKKGELIYHKPGCFYANRIKPERKLPQHTARQRMYYRQAERRAKRAARHRVDVLFNLIEKQDPSMKVLSVC